ncbi:MAG: Gfo/Idh/MocA family protein [Planctomycetota bacterium]|jgi:predicted dehydrogenase
MKDEKKTTKRRKGAEMSRRDFLNGAVAVAAFTIVPRHVLGGPGHTPPSEKLNIAGIGVGGRGAGVVGGVESQNVVALCDVDAKQAAGTFKRHERARKYRDFRRMLDKEDKNIDAVTVATPDHVHAVASMTAIKMGKHVYCEKPLTHSIYEARMLTEAAREHKVATQFGTQGQASEGNRLMCEYILDGAIGPVREVQVWVDRPLRRGQDFYWAQGVGRPEETPPVPETLDWDLWLGPAPERPYNPIYAPFTWRGWLDFGTGALGDMGCHSFDPIFRALKLGYPTSVEATSTLVNEETFPVASIVTYEFPARGDMPPVRLTWYDGGLKPPRPRELEEGRKLRAEGMLFVGDKGKLLNERLIPESRMKEYGKPPRVLPRSPGHFKEWIDACKGGEPARANFDWAGPLTEIVLLGNIALRRELREKLTQTKLYWDGPNMRCSNVPEANEYIRREYRKGWTL